MSARSASLRALLLVPGLAGVLYVGLCARRSPRVGLSGEKKAVMARFMLRTPLGESHGVVSFAAMWSKLDWFAVYVDGERIYGDIDGKPLATEPSADLPGRD